MADGTDNTAPLPPYTAGGNGRRLKMWRVTSAGPNSAAAAGQTILARARHAARNDPWMGAALTKSVANGVATGIQAKPMWGSPAQKDAQAQLWACWTNYADADGVLDWAGLQALAWNEWKEAGEVFIRVRSRRASDGLPVPMQLQVIEAEQCPRDWWSVASNGNQIRCGVEFNAIGKRVAYWMYRTHPGDQDMSAAGNDLVRVPAEQVIHLYKPLRAGQIRGVPDAAAVLTLIWNIGTLRDAVLERQKTANLFVGFVTSDPSGDGGPSALQDAVQGLDADGTQIASLEPGTVQELEPGQKIEFSEPPGAGTEFAEFIRGELMAFAARVGIPYEVLTGDLRNVSDRSLRLILNEFRRGIEMDQWDFFIPILCRGVRNAWFDAAVLGGALDIPDYAAQREDVIATRWVPEGWPYSHPVQDVDAEIKAIRAGLVSRSQVVLENGNDPEEVDVHQAADNARADKAGLSYDSDGRRPQNQGAKPAQKSGEANAQ